MEPTEAQSPPCILSVVSGKGGVGKTTFALSLAYELGDNGNRILLIDFDLYNRGLSQKFVSYPTSEISTDIRKHELFPTGHDIEFQFSLEEVSPRINHLRISPLDSTSIAKLESLPFADLQDIVRKLTNGAIETANSNIALLDCHGGPDSVSYACASISDHVFVLSVPETITFFGTTRFLEGFTHAYDTVSSPSGERTRKPICHVVFNLVSDEFRYKILKLWYKKYFKKYCDNDGGKNDFLLVIPIDRRISIATSRDAFPTREWKYTLVSEKIRILVYHIFRSNQCVKLSRETQFVGKYVAPFIRGSKPFLFSLVDERIPLRVLLSSLVFVVLSVWIVFTFWIDLSSVQSVGNISDLISNTKIFGGILATYTWIFLVGFWLIYAFVARFMVQFDTEVSAKSQLRGATIDYVRNGWRIFLSAFCVLFGILLFFSSDVLGHDFQSDLSTMRAALENGTSMDDGTDLLMRFLDSYIYVDAGIRRVIFGAFTAVFVVRTIRNMYFRFFSGETLYRVFVICSCVGMFAYWH